MFTVVLGIQIIGIAILAAEIIYLFTRNTSRMQLILLVMSICVFVNFTAETAEILSGDPTAALTAVRISYLGKPFIVYTCLLFLVHYCRIHMRREVLVALFIIQASVSIMAFTCPYHALYYTSVGWTDQGLFPHLVLGKSYLYWCYSAFIGLYLVMFMAIIIRQIRRSNTTSQRNQALSLLAMIIVMAGSLGIYLTGVTQGYDLTLVGYALSIVFLVHAILRYNLFDSITLANERALQDSDDGLVVLDQRNDIVFINVIAAKILGTSPCNQNEEPADFEETQTTQLIDKLEKLALRETPYNSQGRYYHANKRDLVKGNTPYGVIYELKDVTESYTYSTRLEHDVQAKTQEIRTIQREITIGFANIVEARDDITGAHIKNTSNYVRIITQSLQDMCEAEAGCSPQRVEQLWGRGYEQALDPNFLEMIVDVAPLHDIGKITISDTILCKPGKLTDEEFEVMKSHAAKGAEVIESTMRGIETDEYVEMAKQVAGFHHERWDGAGYPTGLAGADIPLSARIMAIADVYDALRSKRSYKEAFSVEKSYGIIMSDAGKHFDPVLVEAFKRSFDKIEPNDAIEPSQP